MSYPVSPFAQNFNTQLITHLNGQPTNSSIQNDELLSTTLQWLCSCPSITSYRINTLKTSMNCVKHLFDEQLQQRNLPSKLQIHSGIPNALIVEHNKVDEVELQRFVKEIIVDSNCGCAVLRGAHIFAPGVIGMLSGTQNGDKVSIYVDVYKKCKKGLNKLFDGEKILIGNGLVKMCRHQLFGNNLTASGIAVEVTATTSGCPVLGSEFLPHAWTLLQNLPSMVCVFNLNPQLNETILDMCASPGNKTTHIAELTQNTGVLIAIDKTPSKFQQLRNRCAEFGAKVLTFQADSTKIIDTNSFKSSVIQGPPFMVETFNRILLDAPCSVLGKRPQFFNSIADKVLQSYVPLQRKLFGSAVQLLKLNGTLVYSTCTITLAENEGMVAWALKTFPYLELVRPKLCLGGEGWLGTDLSEEQRRNVQRFGPNQEIDSVGFFIACFNKKST